MSASSNYVCALDESVREYARINLNETDEIRDAALIEIRKWLQDEKPTLHARLEDKYLLPFLRVCQFNLDETKVRITNFYTMKRDEVIWFRNRDPRLNEIQDLVKLGVFVPLKRTLDNKLVVILRIAGHDPKKHSQENVFKVGKMMLDVAAMENEMCQIYGIVALFDMRDLTVGHGRVLTRNMIRRAVHAWQCYHVSATQYEFINAPLYINLFLNIFKSFMPDKMKQKVRVHFGGNAALHKVVDKDILPKEFGGNGESMEELISYWNEKLLSYREWFAEDEQYRAE